MLQYQVTDLIWLQYHARLADFHYGKYFSYLFGMLCQHLRLTNKPLRVGSINWKSSLIDQFHIAVIRGGQGAGGWEDRRREAGKERVGGGKRQGRELQRRGREAGVPRRWESFIKR